MLRFLLLSSLLVVTQILAQDTEPDATKDAAQEATVDVAQDVAPDVAPVVERVTHITNLTDKTFYSTILDNTRHVFVQMYDAGDPRGFPFEPKYEKIAEWFKDEDSCVISELNIYEYRTFLGIYDIFMKPKWFMFPAEGANDTGIEYRGPKTLLAMMDFINKNCGTSILEGGKVDEEEGRLPAFDVLARELKGETERNVYEEVLKEANELLATESEENLKSAKYYLAVMTKLVEKGDTHLDREIPRLQKLLTGYLTPEKRRWGQKRINILNVFKGKAPVEDVVEEEENEEDDWGPEEDEIEEAPSNGETNKKEDL